MGASPGTTGRPVPLIAHGWARPTATGWVLGMMTLLVAGAAINTGANLLFAILGLLLGLLGLTLVASRRSLDGARVGLSVPPLVQAGTDFPAEIRFRARQGVVRLDARELLPPNGVVVVGAGDEVRVGIGGRMQRRCVVRSVEIGLESTWPLHLFRRRAAAVVPVAMHVHPRLGVPGAYAVRSGRTGDRDAPQAGRGGSLRELRGHRPDDGLRRVHWPSTARLGELIVRVDHAEARPEVWVVIATERLVGEPLEPALEEAASRLRDGIAAGAVVHLSLGHLQLRLVGPRGLRTGLQRLAAFGSPSDGADGSTEPSWLGSSWLGSLRRAG